MSHASLVPNTRSLASTGVLMSETQVCLGGGKLEYNSNLYLNEREAQALIPLDFLQSIATERGIKPAELEVVSLLVSGASTTAIASKLGISEDLVRKRLSYAYKKLELEGRGPVKQAQLQNLLHTLYQNYLASEKHVVGEPRRREEGKNQEMQSLVSQHSSLPSYQSPVLNRVDLSEAIDSSIFYGRAAELTQLEQWIVQDGSRLIAVLGLGGIGKTALLAKLAQRIQHYFDFVIWRSLRNAPPLVDLLADVLTSLFHPQELDLPSKSEERMAQLLFYLRDRRCLLILDDVQAILRSNDLFGRYLPGYEEYGVFLRRVGEESHQSCLVLSSQEKLREIALLETPTRPIHSLKLAGLPTQDAWQILQEKGLKGEAYWEDMIQQYRGNPLQLKLVATTIQDVFNKDVAEFIKWKTTVVSRENLDSQFQRLSPIEKEVMYSLAKSDKPLSFQQLREQVEKIGASDLIAALESLGGRSLLEKTTSKNASELLFNLQPVIKKYVTKHHL